MTTISDLGKVSYSSNYRVDALLHDIGAANWNFLLPSRTTLYYTFDCSPGSVIDQQTSEILSPFNAAQKTAAASILSYVCTLTGLSFVETAFGSAADFHFGAINLAGSNVAGLTKNQASYSYTTDQKVTTYSAESYIYLDNVEFAGKNSNPAGGTSGYETLLHEIGHALGLGHPFEGRFPLPVAEDNSNNTVMSYTSAGSSKTSFQSYDLLALTWIYGNDGLGGQYGYNSTYGPSLSSATSADTTAPIVSAFSPANDSTGVATSSNVVVTFSEAIKLGAGTIVLKNAAGTTIETYGAASAVTISIADSTLTINPTSLLAEGAGYRVEFAPGSVMDLAGNNFIGTTAYSFTTLASGVTGKSRVGTAGNDTLTGTSGNDVFDGGSGGDTAIFTGKLADYAVSRTGNTYIVRANIGTDGTDIVTRVESLKFADKTVSLTVQGLAAAASPEGVQHLEELYVAFFNRIPDADGISYWINQMSAGLTINQISESFYNAGVKYSSLTGFSAGMSNADFVNVIYRNTLGRSEGADADASAYWTAKLASGEATHGTLVATILSSAHAFKGNATWGWVPDLLDNKIAVANTFAVEWGLNYNTPEESISHGMAIAASITATGTAAAIALTGVSPADLQLL